ncbi:hypothetical protein ACS0TY_033543 [Phlomoides rotata]
MEVFPHAASNLELSIAIPGFSSSPSSAGENGGGAIKELDINQAPSGTEEECMEEEDEEETSNARRKKLRLTKEQSRFLEQSFLQNQTLNPKEKEALSLELKLKPRQVEVWFQNRRARSKMKQTEVECEYLKRWFAALTEQNRRLQKEVEELRSAPPHCHRQLQLSALTMCPRCERVTATNVVDKGPATSSAFLPRR